MKIAKNGIRVIKREERERQVQRTTETPEQDVGAELKWTATFAVPKKIPPVDAVPRKISR
jgi:hypothetical protein